MNRVGIEPKYDADVIDLLFTMFDEAGENRIQYRNFCTAISPLACADSDLFSVIEYSLKIMDVSTSGRINKKNLSVLVNGMSL